MQTLRFLTLALLFGIQGFSQQQSIQLTNADVDTMINIAKQSSFSGDVTVYRGTKKLFSYSSGFANAETKSPNIDATRFNIGSIGKTITSILIMQLVEKGVLQLEETANTYLPANLQLVHNTRITVRQLLT